MDTERTAVEGIREALARGDDADDAARMEILEGIHARLESELEVDETPPPRR
jgi:hypothetical protein